MANVLDTQEIEIPCESCRNKTKKTIAWIKSNKKFTCRCGAELTINATQFKAQIANVERTLADLQAKLKKFGK